MYCFLFQVKDSVNGDSSDHSPSQDVSYEGGEQSPTKRFRHLNKVLEQKFKKGIKKRSVNPPGHAEIEHYFNLVETLVESADPLLYWESKVKDYPMLSSIVLHVLALPPYPILTV